MRKIYTKLLWLLIFAAGLLGANKSVAQSGIFESYAILNINGGGNQYYDMQATTVNPDLQGATLGNFNASNSLVVAGGQNKTFKCAPCDITNGNLYYRVWLTSAGASGTFTNISEAFLANLGTGCGGNDQVWQGTGGTTNILAALTTPGNYTLEVYSAADYQGCGTGTHFSNNGGANYRATFNFCGPASGALPAGNYAIPGCFPNVAAAVNYINTNGVTGTGNVQFDVAAGLTETAPAGGYAITATGTATLGIIFKKSGGGANPTFTAPTTHTSGSINDAIFKIIGGDYITIDGFTMQENAANTTTAAATNNMTEFGVALFYATATNGAQNNTIQNCTISLNRTYLNTFGIYSNTRTTATAMGTAADASAAAGGNSGNKIYANTISNVNYGIVFIGTSTAAAFESGNDIGGSSAATGNTITNWGGAAAASTYLSLTGNNYCIFSNHQINDNISYNTITSAALTSSVTEGGILKNYSATQPTGTVTTTINNNTITVTNNPSATTTGSIIGINNQGLSTLLATATMSINNNTVQNCILGGTVSTTNGITGITNLSVPGTLNITGNTVSGNSITATTATTGGIGCIANSGAVGTANITGNTIINNSIATTSSTSGLIAGITNSGAAGTANINNNIIRGFASTAASGQVQGINNTGAVVTALNINNNQFGNASGNYFTTSTASSGTLFGIVTSGGAATCALNITGNDVRGITYNTAATSAQAYIQNSAVCLSQNISNNTFTNLNVNTTGNVTFISNSVSAPAAGFKTINGNSIVTAFNKGGAGGTVALYNDGGSSTSATPHQNNNNNFSNITVTGSTAITGWFNNDGTGATPAKIITGNTFNNWTCGTGAVNVLQANFGNTITFTGNTVNNIAGQGSIIGMLIGSSGTFANPMNFSGNTVTGLSSTGAGGAVTGISHAAAAPATGINSISGNTVNTLSSTSTTATVAGIISSGSSVNINGNTINTLSCVGTTSGVTNGIMVTLGTNVSVFKNKIYDLQTTGAFSTVPGVNGILVSSTTASATNNVYNNLVGDLKAPTAASVDAIRGISVTATGTSSTYNISFNTVQINASSTGASFGTSGIFHTSSATATTAVLNLRNNIVVNTSTPVGSGLTVAYRRGSTSLANYSAASNNNLFYAGAPGAANLIFYDGTNSDQTLAAYKARVAARDAASVTENPPFLSTAGASANFLHINTAVPTQIESGAIPVTGITDDYDGDTRNATTPDIGADEGNFILADISGPSITYTPLGNTGCPTDITLPSVAINDPSGVNIAAGTRPRLYYKKSTNADTYVDNTNATDGWKYVEATGTGGSPFSFTTNYALLFGAAPAVGDSISYFVVAQDIAGTPNVGINSGTFAAAPTSVALTAAAFPMTGTVNGYRIAAAGLSGTVTIGATGTYPSITGAGGLFAAINTNGMSGSLTANIIDASVPESGAIALNAISYNGCGTGPYPLLIKPDAGVTTVLTGAVGTGAIIKLNGADFVTFDGSNNGTNSRNMTIQNTTTTTTGNAVIWLASPAVGNGANNDTIKNCIIEGNSATTSFTGVHVGGSTAIGLTTAGNERNNNNAITNNLFRKSQYGVTMFGISAATPDQNNIVNNNNFGTATAGEGFSLLAINAEKQQNLVVAGNEVQNVTNATNVSSVPFGGIRLIDFKDGLCYKNNVHDLAYTNTSTSKIYGIAVTSTSYTSVGNPSNARIYNNMVSRITSTGTSSVWNTTGILASAGYGDKYYYNTVNLNGQVANSSSGLVAAFANGDGNITSQCTNIDVRNNIFSLTGSSPTTGGNFWAYYTAATALTGSILNYNDLYCNGTGGTNNVGRLNATNYATLAAWQTATGQEANSVSIAPVFVSNSDAHLVPGSNTTLNNLGTPIAGITDDIDGDARSATTPDMGADEFNAPICVTAVGGTATGNASACVTYTGTITASGYSNGIGSTYQWVSATNPAGPWTAISGATNPASYTISPAVTETTYYKLAVACATNSSVDSSTVVTITINPRPTVTTNQTGTVTICNPQTSYVNASTDAASPAYQWKKDGVNISGETNAQLIVTVSGVYQVVVTNTLTGCKDSSAPVTFKFVNPPTAPTVTPAAPTICAGNVQLLTASGSVVSGTADLGTGTSVTIAGTTTSALGPNPLQSYYGGAKQQMIVQASELTGLGLTNGSVISALAFNMNFVEARTLQNYTVKVSNTALNAFASNTFEPAGTVVRNPANFTPVAGWNTITFDNNYTWDGTSNLLIEVNFSNNDAGGSGTNTAIYSTTAFASTLFYRVDNTTAAAVDGATTASFAAYTQRNNMRFTFTTPAAAYEWLPATGLFTDAAGTIPYVAGTYTPTVYASPAATTNYTAKALSITCENTTAFTVTVTPAATANAGGNQTICGGNTFTPSGASATNNSGVNWTTSGDGTFANGTTLTPTYTPGVADVLAGTVTLTLTATGNAPCVNATSNMTLTITTTGLLAGTPGGPQVCQTKTVGIGATYNDPSCNTIATVIPAGASPVSGSITSCVKIESSIPTYNSKYYVARHYDIEPAVAPATSSANVVLYFSPAEMAAFNADAGAIATHYPLPVLPTDNIDSVRIEQYHGTGSDPTNYTGAMETWSTANGLTVVFSNGYWVITVPATSFSGFWLTAKVRNPLPIKVEYFRGAKQGSSHVLDWKVVPVNTANGTISLERSSDGRSFGSIYSITASSVRMQQPFNYSTNNLLKGTNYYRLKMTDDNGVVTYSGIVALLNSNKGFELVNITPNPVTEGRFKLNISAAEQLKMEVVVTDMAGRIVSRQTNNLISGFNAIEVNVNTLANGMYQVMGIIEGERTKALKFVKQ